MAAGFIGEQKKSYELWDDKDNTACRVESPGEAGKIHCTKEFLCAIEIIIPDRTNHDRTGCNLSD